MRLRGLAMLVAALSAAGAGARGPSGRLGVDHTGADTPKLTISRKEKRQRSASHPSARYVAQDKRDARKARNRRR